LLIDERSLDQIATAIIRLSEDKELAGNLAAQGRNLVEQSYSRKACAARFSELFRVLIKRK